jgi:drug/metabolite transporter (DMT)-like permease
MKKNRYIAFAIIAAALYAISTPVSKILLNGLSPIYLASLLYLGAGIGMIFVGYIRAKLKSSQNKKFTKSQLPSIIGMIALDIIAPIMLMIGLKTSLPENVSLLNNFEIVATALFAYFIFKEQIPKRLRFAIFFVVIASLLLSVNDIRAFTFSLGSIFVLLATIAWGLENNLTRKLSNNDPLMVVVIKGIFSGVGSLIIAFFMHQVTFDFVLVTCALTLGFVSYGLSIFFYVTAQRELGAAKTSTYYAVAPFLGVILAFIIFQEIPNLLFFIALFLMAIGAYLASTERTKKSL